MIFGVVVLGPMPDQLTWEDYFDIATVCFSGIETFFESEISFFAMLRQEIASENAATDGFSLKYS